eukprot:TRINITY_DN31657_c0_g1_i2.p1 TRINITY_DN31657_c0_g1~~TRINITY_DN31657_c0_g1_i2.p1  ORF type:complete len:428 (+),score=87.34 TRINITY_DN31657_c0_g1_i2:1062-2345(+)
MLRLASAVAADYCATVIEAVALPRLSILHVAPLVVTLRSAGLTGGTCAVIVPLTDDPVDDFGEYSGMLRRALAEGERGILVADGHVVLEARRCPPDGPKTPRDILDGASYGGALSRDLPARLVLDVLPSSCVSWDLRVPSRLGAACSDLGQAFWEELAARHGAAAASSTTHGWFATLDDVAGSLEACLKRQWQWPSLVWPQPMRCMHPYEQHVATLIYLHDVGGSGEDYMTYPEFFCKQIVTKQKGKVEKTSYVPYAGLKVVFPSASPQQASPEGGAAAARSWYVEKEAEGTPLDASLEKATKQLHRLLEEEARLLAGEGRLLIAGAGQGGSMALHAGLTGCPKSVSGVLTAHGDLLESTVLPSRLPAVHICAAAAEKTSNVAWKRLRAAGGDVKFSGRDDAADWDEEAEGACVRDFLEDMWRRWKL